MPRAWAYMATTVPTKMYASGQGSQDRVGKAEKRPPTASVPSAAATARVPRSRPVAKRTATEPSWVCFRPRFHCRKPQAATAMTTICLPALPER